MLLVLLFVVGYAMQPSMGLLSVQAQPPAASETLTDEPAGTPAKGAAPKQRTWIDTFKAGGTCGAVIILLSMIAVGFAVEHALTIRKSRIMPETVLANLEELIARGRVQEAVEFCQDPRNQSLASDVVLAGLERFQTSEFGFAEYKAACEEAGEEETAKLYRKVDVLNLIGVISPMLGLLGTVQGMIESFNTIASRGGMARPDELADGISKALVTTLEGLLVAIPAMVAYSFFRNQIDSLVAEAGKRVERIMSPLARRR
jgi:biopolymer transport protein ExbB